MKVFAKIALISATALSQAAAWAPVPSALLTVQTTRLNSRSLPLTSHKLNINNELEPLQEFDFPALNEKDNANFENLMAPIAAVTAFAMMPLPAEAATGVIPSAIAAYTHYLSLVVMTGCITYERFTVEAGISNEKETSLAIADIGVGLSGVAILVSGYYRATQYGKGWAFYSHEPIFWLKMVFLCIFGAASLFPTITFIKRSVAIQTGKELEPMSEKLASRLQSVLSAELLMVASIPLAASLMSRGVLYTEALPFNYIGPALCAVTAGGLGFKYVKEALTWSED